MKFRRINLMLVILTLMIEHGIEAAQTTRGQPRKSSPLVSEREVMALADRISRARSDVVLAANDYKVSLAKLLVFQQYDVKAAGETVEKRKAMLAENIIGKRELEESERALSAAETKVSETKHQIVEADDLIAEARVEQLDAMSYARRLLAEKKKRERTETGHVYYVRFIIIGELIIYDYTGALKGLVIKYRDRVMHDSARRSY